MTKAASAAVDDGMSTAALDRAIRRILAELHDGLRHGFSS
jgi:Xaa-Pro aminopeptidase